MAHGLEDGIVKLGRARHEEGGVLWLARHDCDRIIVFFFVRTYEVHKKGQEQRLAWKCCDVREIRLVKEEWEWDARS